MAIQITKANLEFVVDQINEAAKTPKVPYKANVVQLGNYHLDWAYGGVKLVQMCSDGGGVYSITQGYDTKKDLYAQLKAFLHGLHTGACNHA